MKYLSVLLLTVLASPALAASGPFFSLYNTDFVVTVAFTGFVALVLYLGCAENAWQDVGRPRGRHSLRAGRSPFSA